MPLIKDSAIVLRRLDYSETSQVLVMFTREHGQQRFIAKGIKRGTRKKAGTGVDLLELGRVVFSQRPGRDSALVTLTEWHQDDNFAHLRRDLACCYAAQYAAEVTSQLTEVNDPHTDLFDGMCTLMRELKPGEVLPRLVAFLWIMLREIGLRPDLSRCVSCNREIPGETVLYFSSRTGGTVCRDCEPAMVEKRRIDANLAAMFLEERWHTTEHTGSAFELLDYHLREIMYRPAKLSAMLRAAVGL